jgi:plastocyanin
MAMEEGEWTMLRRLAIPVLALVGATAWASLGQAIAEERQGANLAARATGVTVGDDFFRPKSLSVRRGTRVRWTWRGRDAHNVTVTSGPVRFRSPTQSTGTFSRKLSRRGTYRIVCTIHGQRMTIKVR